MALGAIFAGRIQRGTSIRSVKAEHEHLWRTELRESLANLLAATDPEIYQAGSSSRSRIVQLTQAVDLMLDREIPEQEQLRHAVIDLSTYVTGVGRPTLFTPGASETFALQNTVSVAARPVLRI